MSRRSIISAERQRNNYESIQNINNGIIITATILDVCGAHKPVTDFIPIELDEEGAPREGFFGSGVSLIVFDHTNKEIHDIPWKGTIDELRTIYGNDDNIKGRRVTLHCLNNDRGAIKTAVMRWEREDDILLEKESSYISLAGISGITVNDWESQMKSFLKPGVGKGRRWNRV